MDFLATNWIAITALVVSVIGVTFTGANYLAGRRERERKKHGPPPTVKATINAKRYDPPGWRSVQLHVAPSDGDWQSFKTTQFIIERAALARPKHAILARARDDHYKAGVFYPETPIRRLEGRVGGHQRFALHFFIRFQDEPQEGQRATFKVTFSGKAMRRRTIKVSAVAPALAE